MTRDEDALVVGALRGVIFDSLDCLQICLIRIYFLDCRVYDFTNLIQQSQGGSTVDVIDGKQLIRMLELQTLISLKPCWMGT